MKKVFVLTVITTMVDNLFKMTGDSYKFVVVAENEEEARKACARDTNTYWLDSNATSCVEVNPDEYQNGQIVAREDYPYPNPE